MPYYIMAQDGSAFAAFDSVESETHSDTCVVTMHNVEEGSPVTDHVRPEPAILSLVLAVTNTPIDVDPDQGRGAPTVVDIAMPSWKAPFDGTPGALFREASGLISGPQPETKSVEVFAFPLEFDRITETEQKLGDMRNASTLCQVVSLSRTYDDMVITRSEVSRTEPGRATFSVDLQQIRFVKTASVAAPVPLEPRGAPMQKKGQQAPKTPQDAATMQKSDLLQIINYAKSLGGGAPL